MTSHVKTLHPTLTLGRRPALSVLTGAAGLIGTAAAGTDLIHDGARHTGELALDVAISHHHDAILTDISRAMDLLCSPIIGPLVVAFIAAVLFRRGWPRAATVLAVSTAGLWLCTAALKLIFPRPRPSMAGVHALVVETKHDSFPSGHTALAAAIAAGAYFTLKTMGRSGKPALTVGIPFVVIVAATRLYLGAHFLGDVTASVLFVTSFAFIANAARPWFTGVVLDKVFRGAR